MRVEAFIIARRYTYLRLSFAGVQPEWIDGCIAELARVVEGEARRTG